jgi:hypothetical protein
MIKLRRRICTAHGKASNADKMSTRKLESKRQPGGRMRLCEDSFKTDPELGVTVRSVIVWYWTGYSGRSSA